MKKAINRSSLFVTIVGLFVFFIIANNYQTEFFVTIDQGVVDYLFRHTNYILVFIFKLLTMLGNWQAIILGIIVMFLVATDKFMALMIAVTTAVSSLLNSVIKGYFMRPRPSIMHLSEASGYSFPSGHAMIATIFYGMIMVIFVARIEDKNKRHGLYALLASIIILISLSRVYLRVHFLSDVIAGIALGSSIIAIIMQLKLSVFDNIKLLVDNKDDEND